MMSYTILCLHTILFDSSFSNLLAIEAGPDSSPAKKSLSRDLQNKLILILAVSPCGIVWYGVMWCE